ncbi:MAG: HlyD family efflux transporter periplasmic adaptor subunit [Planctomycetota bacterium]
MSDQTPPVPDPPSPESDAHPVRGRVIRVVTRVVLVVVILLAGAGVFGLLVATGESTPRNPPGADARRVVAFELEPSTVRRPWRGYGTAEAIDSADVPARVTATVASIPAEVREGRRVAAGETLVRLDAGDFERALASAGSQLDDLRAQLDRLDVERGRLDRQVELETRDVDIMQREVARFERLRDTQSANDKDVDDSTRLLIAAETQLTRTQESLDALPARRRSLEALIAAQERAVEQARVDLERTTIVSPLDGIVEAVDVEVGEQVAVGQRVARLVGLSSMEVGLALPASARGAVVVGDRAELTSVSDGTAWVGEVGRVNPRDDAETRTVTVYVDVEQPGADERFGTRDGAGLLLPGVFVSGWAVGEERAGCWVVPRRSVREGRVMVVDGLDERGVGLVRSLPVDVAFTLSSDSVPGLASATGLPDAEWVVVESAEGQLSEGVSVLVTPPTDLRDGSAVQPVSPREANTATAVGVEAEGTGVSAGGGS